MFSLKCVKDSICIKNTNCYKYYDQSFLSIRVHMTSQQRLKDIFVVTWPLNCGIHWPFIIQFATDGLGKKSRQVQEDIGMQKTNVGISASYSILCSLSPVMITKHNQKEVVMI